MPSKAPLKGEPPPTVAMVLDDNISSWVTNVLQHTVENENTTIPMVNLVFDNDNVPAQTNIHHDNIFIYQDPSGNIQSPEDLFVQVTAPYNDSTTYGSIMTDNVRIKHTNNQYPAINKTYMLNTNNDIHTSNSTINLVDHISTSIKNKHNDGIYELQINTQIQNDSGANRSVTNLISLLHNFKTIEPYPIGGVNSESPAIYCTGFGYLKWYSEYKQLILIPCYYCAEASGTIISPTDIVYSHMDNFNGWQMTTNINSKTGTFTLLARDGINHIKYPTFMRNNLWYHYLFHPSKTHTILTHHHHAQ